MLSKRSTPLIKANKDLILDSVTNTPKGGPRSPRNNPNCFLEKQRSNVIWGGLLMSARHNFMNECRKERTDRVDFSFADQGKHHTLLRGGKSHDLKLTASD